MGKKKSLTSRFSFYLLAIGSACGLGNLWRFPYVVGENGGGAFLLLYVFISLTVGLSIIIAELMIGSYSGQSIIKASEQVKNNPEDSSKRRKYAPLFAWLSVLLSAITLAYYSVISGWVLHYLTQFIVSLVQADPAFYLKSISVNVLLQNGWLQFLLASVHLLVCAVIVVKGFGEKVEKRIVSLLPVFGILVMFLVAGSLSLDSRKDVLRFLFYPDFSKLNFSSLLHAIGHVLFTLSIGFGTMITFGSYLTKEDHLPTIGMRVAFVDTLISIIAVLLVFPIAFSGSKQISTDPSLLFDVLPSFLTSFKGAIFFGIGFFLFLWLSALNASIGLLDSITANLTEKRKNLKQNNAVIITVLLILFITIFPAFSGTIFKNIKLVGQSVIEFFDSVLINFLLPIAAVGTLMIFIKLIPAKDREKMFVRLDKPSTGVMYSHWVFILKWVAPTLVILGFLFKIFSLL